MEATLDFTMPHGAGFFQITPCGCRIVPLAQGSMVLLCAKHEPQVFAIITAGAYSAAP